MYLFIIAILIVVLIAVAKNMRQALRAVEYPTPEEIQIVSCKEMIESPKKFRGKMVQTTGYIRLGTLLQNFYKAERQGENGNPFANTPDHLVMYALTPEPLPRDWRAEGGTLWRTFATNLLVETYDALPNRLTTPNATSATPRITVVGRFELRGETRRLQLHHWVN